MPTFYQEGNPTTHKDEFGTTHEIHFDFDPHQGSGMSRISLTPERHPLSQRFHTLLEDIGRLHDKKQKDYGTTKDPFANVRGATDFGLPSYMGAFIAMNDCMARIKSFVNNNRLENEPLENALKDLAVYSLIALVLYEEHEQIVRDMEKE